MAVKQDYFPDRERFSIVFILCGAFFLLPSAAMCFSTKNVFFCGGFIVSSGIFAAGAIVGKAMIAKYMRRFLEDLEEIEGVTIANAAVSVIACSLILMLWDAVLNYHNGKFTKTPRISDLYPAIGVSIGMCLLYGIKRVTKRWGRHYQ